ncbi:hypothetical protein HZB74_01980 [Candidatus Saccharibacteria bacterium]|nr:hypothetical protein [Candidatus Saccharibacteria bacterium]
MTEVLEVLEQRTEPVFPADAKEVDTLVELLGIKRAGELIGYSAVMLQKSSIGDPVYGIPSSAHNRYSELRWEGPGHSDFNDSQARGYTSALADQKERGLYV